MYNLLVINLIPGAWCDCMATYGQVKFAMGSYQSYRASNLLWKVRSGISLSTDLETMALHDVAACCSRIIFESLRAFIRIVRFALVHLHGTIFM